MSFFAVISMQRRNRYYCLQQLYINLVMNLRVNLKHSPRNIFSYFKPLNAFTTEKTKIQTTQIPLVYCFGYPKRESSRIWCISGIIHAGQSQEQCTWVGKANEHFSFCTIGNTSKVSDVLLLPQFANYVRTLHISGGVNGVTRRYLIYSYACLSLGECMNNVAEKKWWWSEYKRKFQKRKENGFYVCNCGS